MQQLYKSKIENMSPFTRKTHITGHMIDYGLTSYCRYFMLSGYEQLTNQTDPALYWYNTLSHILNVLAHRSNNLQIGHTILIPSQPIITQPAIFKSLKWLGQGLNPLPPILKMSTLPWDHRGSCLIHKLNVKATVDSTIVIYLIKK